jgi:hypothetical protein
MKRENSPAVAHLNGGYGGRWRHPQTDPNVTHGNAGICRREYAVLVAGDRKKKNTDALLIDEPNIIAAKMAAFDKFATDGAKFWLSMSKANPDGKDHPILRRPHKGAVRSMDGVGGIISYQVNALRLLRQSR